MAIEVEKALELIRTQIEVINHEIVPIEYAVGKISAQDMFASYVMPRFNNSAMDGYGVKVSDAGKIVNVTTTILAGSDKTPIIKESESVKIMTGARVPNSVEAIIPQENIIVIDEDIIQLPKEIKIAAHIRYIGEDISKGQILISIGDDINFAKITLLASQGVTHIKIYKKPKVTVFASGEELKLHYEPIENHQIYNSNTPTLIARAKELGCDVTFIGMAHDSIKSLKELINNSLDADILITSGGVSVGEADFTKEAFNELGIETIFDGITIKPGKPTVLGKIGKTIILNLPGNPLASSLIFELFGKIIIQKMNGSKSIYHNTIKTKNHQDIKNKKGRATIIPGYFDGEKFEASQKRSPGMIDVLSNCNCMVVLDKDVEMIKEDQDINILPINWKFFTSIKKDYLTYGQ